MSIVATAPAVQTLLRTVKKERPEAWGDAPATCHETFLTSQQARYDQQEAFMIIYDHLCKRFFSKHFRADAPSTIIKHGLLENSPFSLIVSQLETSIYRGFSIAIFDCQRVSYG
jgi:hypothetical protein